jgi:hypothetical protein
VRDKNQPISQINGFVIAAAPVLLSVSHGRTCCHQPEHATDASRQKENITINAVLPGVVPSPLVNQEMRDTFGADG